MPRRITIAAIAGGLIVGGSAQAANDGPAAEAAAIRALRLDNNRALAEHRLDDVMALAADDYVLVGGNDGIYRSRAEMTALWREDFADPNNKGCVRTTEAVEVGAALGVMRAAETGHWVCTVVQPGAERRRSGRYLAHWTKRSGPGGWCRTTMSPCAAPARAATPNSRGNRAEAHPHQAA